MQIGRISATSTAPASAQGPAISASGRALSKMVSPTAIVALGRGNVVLITTVSCLRAPVRARSQTTAAALGPNLRTMGS